LIDTCFKFGFRSADIYLNQTLRSAVGEYKVDKDRIERADLMLNVLFGFLDKGFTVETCPALNSFAPFGILLSASTTRQSKL
jgi:hypothetical protein